MKNKRISLISWNCNGAFRKKVEYLKPLDTELWVIQEAEDPKESTKAYQELIGENYIWIGSNKNKGLLVVSTVEEKVLFLDWDNPENLQMFIPFVFKEQVFLAAWTKQADSPTFGYIGQLWKYIKQNKHLFERHRPIIVGDLNSNVIWDKWDRWWNHSDIVRILEGMGIKSLYHHVTSDIEGKEKQPTFFLHRKVEKAYHIDYCFVPKPYQKNSMLEIGSHEKWIEYSDHLPMIIELEDKLDE